MPVFGSCSRPRSSGAGYTITPGRAAVRWWPAPSGTSAAPTPSTHSARSSDRMLSSSCRPEPRCGPYQAATSNTPRSLIPLKLATTQTSSIVDGDVIVIAPEVTSVDRFAARTCAVHRRCPLNSTHAPPSAQQTLLIAAGVPASPAHRVQPAAVPAPACPEHQKRAAAVMV